MLSPTRSIRRPTRSCGRAPHALRRAAAGTLVLLLAGCSSVDWVKTRFVEPAAAPVAAPSPGAADAAGGSPAPALASAPAAASSAQASTEAPTYRRRLRDAPPSATAVPPPATAAAVAPPVAPPAAAAPPVAVAPAAAVATPVAAAPAPAAPVALPPAVAVAPPAPVAQPLTAPVPPRAVVDLAPGRFAVQVAAFMTPASAEAQRSRTATQLRAAALPEADATRVLKLNDRYYVLVGDLADRAQADALAAQVRAAVRHDVVIFRR
jgi:hypothetical protein